jgi:RimJ/RimL family protein N-acetyltransferase
MRMNLATQATCGRAPSWWRSLEWEPWSLELRPVRASDALRVSGALTDEIARWTGVGTVDEMRSGAPVWAAVAGDLARRREAFRYLVYVEGRFAGTVELRSDAVRGHVGYWLRRSERGKGSATRAVALLLPIAFEGLGLPAVDFTAQAANRSSIAVMERLGASFVGRSERIEHGRRVEEVRYRVRRRGFRPAESGPHRLAEFVLESDKF